ncbi:MAG TPA: hypothetical protein DCE42_11720 [Myxococcales bacterium]|nr:hypothetical protein [Deltaproteobacteria bacterium]HAA55418.1 hypothetical protein [Myxococcales bacterium]|tara:strand:- start:946 stop:1137 length:192 start_codon:yes stop_codon:yes gene_type:complete
MVRFYTLVAVVFLTFSWADVAPFGCNCGGGSGPKPTEEKKDEKPETLGTLDASGQTFLLKKHV